jgi:hypothetical protein
MGKLADVAVVVGSFKKDGQEKFKWKTVGALIEGANGKQYVMLDKTFNPAGVPTKEGSDQITLSFFYDKDRQQSSPEPKKASGKSFYPDDLDNDQPF